MVFVFNSWYRASNTLGIAKSDSLGSLWTIPEFIMLNKLTPEWALNGPKGRAGKARKTRH